PHDQKSTSSREDEESVESVSSKDSQSKDLAVGTQKLPYEERVRLLEKYLSLRFNEWQKKEMRDQRVIEFYNKRIDEIEFDPNESSTQSTVTEAQPKDTNQTQSQSQSHPQPLQRSPVQVRKIQPTAKPEKRVFKEQVPRWPRQEVEAKPEQER